MKRNLLSQCAIVLATVTTMSVVAPSVSANTASDLDDVNTEIKDTKAKIAASQKKIDAATEVQMKKSQKINDLKVDIAKRDGQLKKQAQSAQINNSGSVVQFLSDSENVSDAIGRGVTVARVVHANNQTMEQQKNDKSQVEAEQADLTKSVKDQKDEKMSLLKMKSGLDAKQAELTAKKNKEDETAQANAKAAKKAAEKVANAKDLETAGRAADEAHASANADAAQKNRDNQNDAVKNDDNTGLKVKDNNNSSNSNSNNNNKAQVQQVKLGGSDHHGKGGGPNAYPYGECTYYVKMAAPWVGGHWGNGQEWAASASAAGFRVDHTPSAGSVAVYAGGANVGGWTAAGGYGHVALVQSVNGGSVTITQGGNGFSNPTGPNTQTLSAGAAMAYIHP
ncbi:CHAP domain-containing protein [Ligilactobacillus pobuzihii]|uniref:CHAP domain-containing protein n=1 Tax=Ligilactobacillus pobuzihii TaxID=449659 RepID=UPI0019CF9C41|nr:CHAP domain-containing protein [Ligilactobacillus pobuzihii]MBN7274107.1 CHAP domain-containing protein [Ligilactobacillus pobuzihii]